MLLDVAETLFIDDLGERARGHGHGLSLADYKRVGQDVNIGVTLLAILPRIPTG